MYLGIPEAVQGIIPLSGQRRHPLVDVPLKQIRVDSGPASNGGEPNLAMCDLYDLEYCIET